MLRPFFGRRICFGVLSGNSRFLVVLRLPGMTQRDPEGGAENRMIYLTRRAEFSASHYYHNPDFSPEENRRIFGKCNNPHGHNYTVEVTVAGEVDQTTGMVLDLKDLKAVLETEVMQRMDH